MPLRHPAASLAETSRLPTAPRPDRQRATLRVSWADSLDDVRDCQRLRFQVFAIEMGATLKAAAGTPAGHDADRFDDFCSHLIVRASFDPDETGEVVGTYRVLTPSAARRAGGFYSETEFDLSRLAPMSSRMAELGRSCIHPAWRNGGTILLLWAALGDFMLREKLDVSFGCASVNARHGGHDVARLWRRLSALHTAPPERRVVPWQPYAMPALNDGDDGATVDTPPLIKGYLRCGAELLGPPAWDADFCTADFPMLMTLGGLPQRHRRHFLDGAMAAHECVAKPAE